MSAKIVSLSGVIERRRNPILDQAITYWDGLRNGRIAPSRAEIDPRGLPGILPHCFILQRIAPGMARFRICGRHLSDVTGVEMAGLPFSSLLMPDYRDGFETTLEEVFSTPATAILALASPSGYARPEITGQMALMPLRDDLGAVTRILGCVSLDGTASRAPRTFGIRDTRISEVPKGRPLYTGHRRAGDPPPPLTDTPAEVIPLPLPAD